MNKYNTQSANKASKKQIISEGTYRRVGEFVDSHVSSHYAGNSQAANYGSGSKNVRAKGSNFK